MQRAYYAVIPANVRYDKNLPANAKLLYGEITALCNEKGYCWAGDKYFADLYGVSKTTVQNWLKSLFDNKYISREIEYKEGSKEILHRYIRILEYPTQKNLSTPTQENLSTPTQKNLSTPTQKNLSTPTQENLSTPTQENLSTPTQENLRDNNTLINNTNNNMSSSSKDNIPYKKIIEHLNQTTESKFSFKSDSNRKLISGRWNEGNELETFLDVINLKAKQWKDNPEMSKYLRPATLFSGKNFENYKAEALAGKRKHTPNQPKSDFDFNELEKMFGDES